LLDINMLRSLDYMMPGQQGELTGTFERRLSDILPLIG